MRVTTLNPTGAGSLSEALNTTGARTIGFDVTGDIDFASSKITIQGRDDFTLDFSDAPGNGVQIVNGSLYFYGCGNFIVQYAKVRPAATIAPPNGYDGIIVARGSHHFVLRHCEVETASDDGIAVFLEASYADIHDFVLENNLVAFGVRLEIVPGSALGMAVDGSNGAGVGNLRRFSIRNNIVANEVDRAPKIRGFTSAYSNYLEDCEIINNLAYNIYAARPEVLDKVRRVRSEGNMMLHGPSETSTTYDFQYRLGNGQADCVVLSSIYQANNWGRNYDGLGSTRTAIIGGYDGPGQAAYEYLSSSPHNWTTPITDPDDLVTALVTGRACGAVLPAIDDLTAEVYRTIEEDAGYMIDYTSETGVNPTGAIPGLPDLTV